MAIQKRPYELSVWVEKLNGSNSKIEEKGVIIGAHDMSYPGRATNLVLKREVKGTNTLTFQMPDRYFDSLKGEFVRNEFIDLISPETKLKLFYKDRWFEFFVKKVDEKKQFKSYMKSFTCSDAFIDELSRNGYGIIYDTDLNNNVEEIGVFTEETLEDSIWKYHPEHNWGDFTEYKEEKLYRIPISCFGGVISGYKLNFNLEQEQIDEIKEEHGTDEIDNVFTGDKRIVELSDDLARGYFWDEYVEGGAPRNALTKDFHTNIANDGYIYVPYSCLSFCYGSEEEPDFTGTLSYDRAATETAISINDKLILAPQSVDPRTLIQFYAIPDSGILELDDGGVIMNKDYTFFMTLSQWNRAVNWDNHDWWYMFEDTRLVKGEILGSVDQGEPLISHTFKYLKDGGGHILDTDYESRGNKCVVYDGYLSNVQENSIVKGKKFSITNRTEVNISEDIDQYTTIYNAQADDFRDEYTNEDWDYKATDENKTTSGEKYRVCSKLETRQIIPQLARNLVQNGTDMNSTDGWSPMTYLLSDSIFITPAVSLRGVETGADAVHQQITTSALVYNPAMARVGEKWLVTFNGNASNKQSQLNKLRFNYNSQTYTWDTASHSNEKTIAWCDLKDIIDKLANSCINTATQSDSYFIYAIGTSLYIKEPNSQPSEYKFLCDKNDFIYKGLIRNYGTAEVPNNVFTISSTKTDQYEDPDDTGLVEYYVTPGGWSLSYSGNNVLFNRTLTPQPAKKGNIKENNGQEIVNFGIIGQDKKIEKDKIYCLGISAWTEKDFKIKIGKGGLISDGQYEFTDSNKVMEFNVGTADNAEIRYDLQAAPPTNYEDPKKNLHIDRGQIPITKYILFKSKRDIENPYFVVSASDYIILFKLYLFEAYTKGQDAFPSNESTYRYSGRDLFWPPKDKIVRDNYESVAVYDEEDIKKMIIFEQDIMLGSTYGYQHYYIQRLKTHDKKKYDTMGKKDFLTSDIKELKEDLLPLDAAKYTEDDYVIETNYIDLNKCPYYNQRATIDECDCNFGGEHKHTCFYQKFGYCPFRFQAEKHDRRIRTLSINKSNRFNIIQQTSKVFEVYPQFYIQHKPNGSVIKDDEGNYLKQVFYITEKGRENKIGFRYEKNLKDISRNIVSDKIVTKLYVLDVDSDLSKTGLCSIKTAEDNPSKDSYLIDLSYYIEKGMLDGDEVEQDLYGITPTSKELIGDEIPSGFLGQLGYYNTQYDNLSNKIINLQDASYTELEANLEVNYQGIITAQEQILKIKKQIDNYKSKYTDPSQYQNQQAYLNYLAKMSEQESILVKLIYDTFYTDGLCDAHACENTEICSDTPADNATAMQFFACISDFEGTRKYWIDKHQYTKGILGQFNKEYTQIQQWKRERASYLKLINQISAAFFKKYEPYLKEGTWSDSNYLTDNAYYFGALDVAADGAIPKVSYSISVIDIAPLSKEYEEIYDFDLADVTYIEDIGMFGINKHTGFPNRLKVLVSGVQEGIDDPSKDTIQVQNFTTSFQDLFQQVSASVQSLTYNENIYKRSSNFTSLQSIKNDSLQGALDTNDLTLLNTEEENIQVDNTGTHGSDINNHANKYKLDGQGLFFSNDGGQHWSVGVGPSGINADYIKVGTLDAGKIRIADSAYIYFSWDKDGIVAYRDPQAVNTDTKNINDAAIFNKYGLSIVANNNIKLRAGYSYTGSDGSINSEESMGDSVGFYLYNNKGKEIFKTTSAVDDDNSDRESAILSLIGEMKVSDTTEVEDSQGDTFKTRYSFNSASFAYASLNYPVPNIHSTQIEDETTHQTYNYYNSTGSSFSDGCLAAYLLENENLSEITIQRDSAINVYRKINSSTISYNNDSHYCGTTDTNISYEVKKEYSVTISRGSGNYTVYFYDVRNMSTNTTQKHFLSEGGDRVNFNLELNIKANPFKITEEVNAASYQFLNISYYIRSNNGIVKDNIDAYRIPSLGGYRYYEERVPNGAGSTSRESAVGLYLNNPALVESSATGTGVQRLFVCCAQKGSSVSNLFSVLKNGTVYIGGTIENNSSAINLTDKITISQDVPIKIENGQLYIRFKYISDPDYGSLDGYITNAINENGSAIQNAINNRIDEIFGGLNSRIDGIDGFHDHLHHFNTPDYNVEFDPGQWAYTENIKDVYINVYADDDSSHDSGRYQKRIPLKRFIESFSSGGVI